MRRSPIAGPTTKQDQFAQRFALNGGNAREAYRHAFPKSRTARYNTVTKHAARLIALPHVQERIKHYQAIMRGRVDETFRIEADRVLRHLLQIAESKSTDFMTWGIRNEPIIRDGETVGKKSVPWLKITPSDQLSPQQAAVVKSVTRRIERDGSATVTVELCDRLQALTLLGKNLGLFTDKIEHTGKLPAGPIIVMATPQESEA